MKYAYIEISGACNLSCSFCPYSKGSSKAFMSETLFSTITQKLAPHIQEIYLHILGEPLLHPHLKNLLKIAADASLPVNITTNGTLIQQQQDTLLSSSNLRQINFSTHALEEIKDIDQARDLVLHMIQFAQQAMKSRPDLYINFRLWNLKDNTNTTWNSWLKKTLSQSFNCEFSGHTFSVRHKSFWIRDRIYLHMDTRFDWPKPKAIKENTSTHEISGTCMGLISHIGVLLDGTVVPCCLDYSGAINLGNLKTQNFEEVLTSPRALKIKKSFLEHKLIEGLCQTCGYCKRFKKSLKA